MTREQMQHAAELLDRLLPQATPGPWRDQSVDLNRYSALIAQECSRDCDQWKDRWSNPPTWASHPHDGYGGCLIAETMHAPDRRLMAVLRNVADHLPDLLRAVAAEDPAAVGQTTRALAAAVVTTHTPAAAP